MMTGITAAAATLAIVAALAATGTASARTVGTCRFKHNTAAVGIGIGGSDVGAGICSAVRASLGSGWHSGKAMFAHPRAFCAFQFHRYQIFAVFIGERYGKIATGFCRALAPKLTSSGWRRVQ
jgi:hypothetical protein